MHATPLSSTIRDTSARTRLELRDPARVAGRCAFRAYALQWCSDRPPCGARSPVRDRRSGRAAKGRSRPSRIGFRRFAAALQSSRFGPPGRLAGRGIPRPWRRPIHFTVFVWAWIVRGIPIMMRHQGTRKADASESTCQSSREREWFDRINLDAQGGNHNATVPVVTGPGIRGAAGFQRGRRSGRPFLRPGFLRRRLQISISQSLA